MTTTFRRLGIIAVEVLLFVTPLAIVGCTVYMVAP